MYAQIWWFCNHPILPVRFLHKDENICRKNTQFSPNMALPFLPIKWQLLNWEIIESILKSTLRYLIVGGIPFFLKILSPLDVYYNPLFLILPDQHFVEPPFCHICPNFFIFVQIFDDFQKFLAKFSKRPILITPFIFINLETLPLIIDPPTIRYRRLETLIYHIHNIN